MSAQEPRLRDVLREIRDGARRVGWWQVAKAVAEVAGEVWRERRARST